MSAAAKCSTRAMQVGLSSCTERHRHEARQHARSIMYDAGTESESFEWYRVRGAPKSECRLTQQRIDILSLPHPPVATAAAPRAPMPAAPAPPRRGSGGRKGALP